MPLHFCLTSAGASTSDGGPLPALIALSPSTTLHSLHFFLPMSDAQVYTKAVPKPHHCQRGTDAH